MESMFTPRTGSFHPATRSLQLRIMGGTRLLTEAILASQERLRLWRPRVRGMAGLGWSFATRESNTQLSSSSGNCFPLLLDDYFQDTEFGGAKFRVRFIRLNQFAHTREVTLHVRIDYARVHIIIATG